MAALEEYIPEEGASEPAPSIDVEALIDLPNIAVELGEEELAEIGDDVVREWQIDRDSMEDWLKQMEGGIKLAKLGKDLKSYPFDKASNIKYPLLTTAALQFNAKAYPAIVQSDQIVKVKVYGADRDGKKAARADRVAEHMSYDLDCNVPEWEEDTDNLLTVLPLVGTCYRKWWWDLGTQRKRCRLITPGDFTVNDHIKRLEDAPRLTEEISLYPSEIQTRKLTGEWLDQDYRENQGDDSSAPELFLEQHRLLDLDEDGTEEPYVVTVHKVSRKVARIVADFEPEDIKREPTEPTPVMDAMGQPMVGPDGQPLMDPGPPGQILSIQRGSYFIAYKFLPSLDGGFHGTGLGLLLGDITESINTTINMMLDAGHMQALGGGFIGADFRIKGGAQRFNPGEWKLANASGSAVKDSIVPMTFPGPSAVLFELLGMLVDAGKEVSSTKDILAENAGKAMTATQTMAIVEKGEAQASAAYKRIYRSLKLEFKLIAKLNARYTSAEEYNRFHDDVEMVPGPPQMGPDGQPQMGPDGQPGQPQMMPQPVQYDPATEYDLTDMDIKPVADPSSVTRSQQMGKAQLLMEMSEKGQVNPQQATQRILEAANIEKPEELQPQPDPMQQQMFQAELQEKQAHAAQMQADAQAKGAEVQKAAQGGDQMELAKLQAEIELIRAQIQQITMDQGAKVQLDREKAQADFGLKQQVANMKMQGEAADRQLAQQQAEEQRQMAVAKFQQDAQIKSEDARLKAEEAQRRAAMDEQKAQHAAMLAEQKAQQELAQDEERHRLDVENTRAKLAAELRAKEEDGRRKDEEHRSKQKAEAKASKPKVKRTKVTKHDDEGRIAEFETRED
jgi:chaperonin GroES